MTKRTHSIGLKLFIFLLVAMMLFSAIGVMVIYLNVPTTTTPGLDVTTNVVTEPTTITVPSADTPTVEAPTPDTVAPEA
jgi:uncharacterized protein with PQ loop repeat